MLDYIADNAGMMGLLFFFSFFVCVFVWTYLPSRVGEHQEHATIPLKDEDDE